MKSPASIILSLLLALVGMACAPANLSYGENLRVLAGNLTGDAQECLGPAVRIIDALDPDIVLIQEFVIGEIPEEQVKQGDIDAFVKASCGEGFYWMREPVDNERIPNGIISRWPIVKQGEWRDALGERDLAWAKIDLPGSRDLLAVSAHFSAGSSAKRVDSAKVVVAQIKKARVDGLLDEDDFLLFGGDLNADGKGRCIPVLKPILETEAPYPADQAGNIKTNNKRQRRYDWVLAGPALDALEVPVKLEGATFRSGLVFDSRVTKPFSLLGQVDADANLRAADSGANQHMAVVRDFGIIKEAP